jgi:hypothetical protein
VGEGGRDAERKVEVREQRSERRTAEAERLSTDFTDGLGLDNAEVRDQRPECRTADPKRTSADFTDYTDCSGSDIAEIREQKPECRMAEAERIIRRLRRRHALSDRGLSGQRWNDVR